LVLICRKKKNTIGLVVCGADLYVREKKILADS
jgi:hypothetical protein